ncbi:MAG: sodium:solute symporter family protein [Candidatus Aminicenantes bacterium]|nr:MAG: sodium:solute symporter family protein [Candidatus Aminicenantes bacterium]
MALDYFLFLAAYLAILLSVGLAFTKRMSSLEDFFLASRDLSGSWIFLTLVASWLGATSFLVSVDSAYQEGVSSLWVMGVPALLTVLIFFLFLARPIRNLSILTLPDLVELRYGRPVRHLASVLIIWYMILLAASQMVALGNFLQVFLQTSYFSCLMIGTVVVLIYSVLGGFFSVVFTDGIQFFFLFGGIFGLFIYLVSSSTFQDVSQTIQNSGRLDYFSFFADFKTNSLITLSFVLAWVVSPIVWQRIQAARSVKIARQGLAATSIALFLIYGIFVIIGLLSLPLVSVSETGGPVLSAIIATKTGKILGGILFVAVVAAIMSTMDTGVNTGAMSMTHDVYFQLFPSKRDDHVLLVSRISTLVVAALAFLVATQFQSILKTLGLASEIMAVGFFIPGVSMIFLKKKWPSAGFLSLVLGGGFALVGFFCEIGILALRWPAWPFSVPYGLALSLAGFILGILIDKSKVLS